MKTKIILYLLTILKLSTTHSMEEHDSNLRRRNNVSEYGGTGPRGLTGATGPALYGDDSREFDCTKSLISKNFFKEENSEEELDKILSSLGKSWTLFKHKDYENAFQIIYVLSLTGIPQADYLIALFYEYGLGKIFKSPKNASNFYVKTIVDTKDRDLNLLEMKAEEGLKRTLLNIQF